MNPAPGLRELTSLIAAECRAQTGGRSLLVAVSGIDGAGKGFVAARLSRMLRQRGLRVAEIGIDPWLNLPTKRFSAREPARHFYEHAIRFDELFRRLVLPLKSHRSIRLEAELTEETATRFRRGVYEFDDVDVIVLEGIYLLKRQFRRRYDLSVWVECSFETALERAVTRAQEGLPPTETARAYWKIYFPAQWIHLQEDTPRSAADMILLNDRRLGATVSETADAAAVMESNP